MRGGVSRGGTPAAIADGVKTFRGVEHRLEFVAEIGGVEFYNDSKATNVDAALKAIEAFSEPLMVILGGKDKGSPYTPLAEPLRERARLAILIGAAAEKIAADLGDAIETAHAGTLERAVQLASERARPGDVVLLAPACSSFDQFENYEERGRIFKELVARLEGRPGPADSAARDERTGDATQSAARSKAIWRDAGAVPDRRRDGVQRVGSDGARRIRQRLLFPAAPGGVDRVWNRGNVLADEYGLPQAAAAARDFHGAGRDVSAADRGFFSRQLACHASLDPPGAAEPAALGTRKARRDFLPRVVSGIRRAPRGEGVNNVTRTLLPAVGTVLLMVALVYKEPDLGTACMIFFIAAVMLFVAGISIRYIVAAAAVAVPVVAIAILSMPYRIERVKTFFSPGSDPQGHGFQLLQSLIAVGSGGFTGVGLMESKQKLFFLPEAHTDFIFAVLCEELGFIGGAIVLALFAVYGWRGFVPRLRPRTISAARRVGITVMVLSQAMINLGVVLGMMPTKGIPLPFVSYGGSSLLVMLLATGMLLNISQQADEM